MGASWPASVRAAARERAWRSAPPSRVSSGMRRPMRTLRHHLAQTLSHVHQVIVGEVLVAGHVEPAAADTLGHREVALVVAEGGVGGLLSRYRGEERSRLDAQFMEAEESAVPGVTVVERYGIAVGHDVLAGPFGEVVSQEPVEDEHVASSRAQHLPQDRHNAQADGRLHLVHLGREAEARGPELVEGRVREAAVVTKGAG